jgi:hypothetical protein
MVLGDETIIMVNPGLKVAIKPAMKMYIWPSIRL